MHLKDASRDMDRQRSQKISRRGLQLFGRNIGTKTQCHLIMGINSLLYATWAPNNIGSNKV